ncbi:kinase [Amnibacterium soli]|uniref:Kinase n=1 Tax=Amnibacterium soli TaxID=1282736 RepID=A0ABP8Z9E4_9MICO
MLIVLRGNSGSGKSTVAEALQQELGWPTAVLEQDHFRRVVYAERQGRTHPTGMAHAALLEAAAAHCLGQGQHLVLEGVFNAERYAGMLERIAALADDARFLAFDLSFEETVRRHADRPKASAFDVEEMRGWYHGWNPLPFVEEQRIGADESVAAVVRRVLGGP